MTDLVQDRPSHVDHEDDFRDTAESSSFVEWLKRSSAIAAPIALTQVILTPSILHANYHSKKKKNMNGEDILRCFCGRWG